MKESKRVKRKSWNGMGVCKGERGKNAASSHFKGARVPSQEFLLSSGSREQKGGQQRGNGKEVRAKNS